MSDDTSLGASLYRRHTMAALSAQTRDGARISFGEALHARHAQFAQQLLRRASAREQSSGVQRTFVVARRVASAAGSGDDAPAPAPVVADAAGGDAVGVAPSMHDVATSARQDARPASGERVISKLPADAAAVVSRRVREAVGDTVHVASLHASQDAAAHGAQMPDAHASSDAGAASMSAVSDTLEAPVASSRPSGSMPPAPAVPPMSPMPPVVVTRRPALEPTAITRASPTPLAAALSPIARSVTSMALRAPHADLTRASVTEHEHAHAEPSPEAPGLHDARSVSAAAFIARQMQDGPAAPFVTRRAESRNTTAHVPDAPLWRRAATTAAYELPVVSLMPEAASDSIVRENVGGSTSESAHAAHVAHAAFTESTVQSAQPSNAARDGVALPISARPFEARPIARAVLSTSRSTHPAIAGAVLSPMALVARQTLSSTLAAFIGGNRTVGMRPTASAANLVVQGAVTKAGASSTHAEAAKISVPDSAFAPAPDHPVMVLRRADQAVVSMPEGSITSGMARTTDAPTVARASKDDEASPQVAASNVPVVPEMSNAPDVSSTSSAAGGSLAPRSEPATLLPRVPNASAAHVALKPMPVAPANVRTHRSDGRRGSEAVAGASIAVKEMPLSSAIRRAVDAGGEVHRPARGHDIAGPSSAGGAFVDSDHGTGLPLAKGMSHPQAVIDRQSQHLPLTHETLHPQAVIDRQSQPLPLTHETSNPRGEIEPETHLSLTRGTSHPQGVIDRPLQRLPLTHEPSNPRGGIERETHLPLARGTSHPQAAIDRQTQAPLVHAMAPAALSVDRSMQTALAHDAATPASAIDHAQPPLEHTAVSRGPDSQATQRERAASREPTSANLVQRTPVASPTVKPQPLALRAGDLPLRLARALHVQRVTRSAGVPSTAWGERAIASADAAREPAIIDRTAEMYGVLSPITPVMRDLAAPTAPGTPPPGVDAHAGTPVTPAAGPAATSGVDADELAERAWQLILDKLAIEQERRGYTSWTW